MSDRVGQQIGNYRLERLLGSGGFADVYLGKQVYLDSLAAIKLLKTTLIEGDINDFRTEARTLVHLIHPHIVRVLDFGLEGNTPFLVMDYAPNGTLRQRHARGERLPLATVIGYVNQVASALQFAHDQKIIHRDVKPENMLLGRQNEILLSDFGIAVVAQSTRTEFTQETVGTISYMAPEQIQAHPRPASDQYSLGVIAYEWLCGDRPFNGTFTEIAVKHMMAPVPPLREKMPSISPDVEQVIFTALAKDPTQRFGSIQAFATALEQASRSLQASFPTLAPTQLASPPTPLPNMAPTVVASPATPILPLIQPDAHNTPAHPQANSPVVDTPGTPFAAPSPAFINANAPTVAVPSVQPFNPATPPPPAPPATQRQPEPERRGISRRAALIAGVSAVGVVVIGGTALALATHNGAGQTTTGGTQTTPSATTHTTTATAQVNTHILAEDTFQRANQLYWGKASDGLNSWGGDANNSSDFSIANTKGQILRQVSPNSLYTATLGSAYDNAEVLVTAMISTFSNSHIGIFLRYHDDNHYYKVVLDQNGIHFLKRIDPQHGPTIGNQSTFSSQPNTSYTIRFRVTGAVLQAKAWKTGTTEPNSWMITANDNDATFQRGQGGLRPQLDHGVMLQVSMFQETLPNL